MTERAFVRELQESLRIGANHTAADPMFLQPRSPGQILSPLLKQVTVILNPVVKAAPALIDPLYLMAQVKYLSGEPVGPVPRWSLAVFPA